MSVLWLEPASSIVAGGGRRVINKYDIATKQHVKCFLHYPSDATKKRAMSKGLSVCLSVIIRHCVNAAIVEIAPSS